MLKNRSRNSEFLYLSDFYRSLIKTRFAGNSVGWEEEYATAFCKLSHFGASYSVQVGAVHSVLYLGTLR